MDSLPVLLWVYGLFFLISLVAALFKAHYKTLFFQVIFPQLAVILLLFILLAATSLISNGEHEARDLIMGEILPGSLLAGGALGWFVVGRRKYAGALCHLFMLFAMLGLIAVSHPVLWSALNCDEGWYWELGPLPWLYSYVSTLLLILAFFYQRCRQMLLWVMLPQWAVVGGLLFALDYFDQLSGAWLALFIAVPIYLCVGVLPALVLGFWMKRVWLVWLLCHLLFLGSMQIVMPGLWRGFIPGWQEKSRIALLERTKHGDFSELEDIDDRDALEKLLSQSAEDPGTPEVLVTALQQIQKQKAPLPEAQMVNFITGEENPALINAYHRAGLTCDALFAMVDRVYPEGAVAREVTLNSLHEQCRNE
ncbi:hypothetical protein [Pseudocitrobacter sp. 73]|uniref:hypothetical protein n=1 Tax=Pseudocitrobacter sp. 73 TaxID=2605731 RepID=UPI0011EF0EA5|nr:hypothetical protein [Pseudocitrobacter sp. 73]KAA1047852.1 hypothetical protein F0Q32_15970 [Pseudocitrobacter sp. 73]